MLTTVKSFVASGRTRQVRGSNLVPIEFEITCELPNRYVRRDQIPAQDSDLAVSGFTGDELIQSPQQALQARSGGPAPPPSASAVRGGSPVADGRGRGGPPAGGAEQRLVAIKQDFARLMLGVFATSFPSYP